ncbi:esterase/lipase family protein, partial [Halioglobus sp. HI00S01]
FGLILWLLLAPQVRADDYLAASADRCVILLHGMLRSSLSLKPMQWYLDHAGYTTVNLSYPSLLYPIPESAEM